MINENLANGGLVSNENLIKEIKIENFNNKLVVSSRIIADRLDKEHRHVLDSLDNILNQSAEISADIIKSTYKDIKNREYREYLLTRKGLYVYFNCINGFITEKMAFYDKFEEMENKLANPFNVPTSFKEALKLALEQQEEIEKKNQMLIERDKLIEEQKPKVLFAESVETSNTSILIRDFVKILVQKGIDIGEKRLFEWLRDNDYLMKFGSSKNKPTQRAMDMGLFEIKETAITHSSGNVILNITPKITGKGQTYFVNKFLNA